MALFEYYVPNFSENPSLLAILIILTVIAILLNANVIIAIIVKKRLHTFANILAVSLAIGDLILALSLCLLQSESEWNTIKQTANLKDTWLDRCSYTSNTTRMTSNIPTAVCYNDFTIMLQDLTSMVVTTAQMAVILHLLAMTIDRYFAIVHPLTHYFYENYGMSNQKKAIAICILIWIISFTFSAVYYSMFSGVTQPTDNSDTYVTIGYYAIIIACLIITFFLNIPIVMTATVPTDLDKEQNNEGFASLLPQNMKMAVTFFLILTCISVGYTPDCIVYVLRNNNHISTETFNVHYTYIVIVKLLTCIINPMIYGLRTFKVTFSVLCPKKQLKSTATITTSVRTPTTRVKTTQKRGSEVGEKRTTFQHSSSLLFKKRRESDQLKKRAIPKLIVVGIMLIYLFGTCAFLFVNLNDRIEETEWPSDGALGVFGGCLKVTESSGCDNMTAKVEILAAPGLIPDSCTIPPSFPENSFNHGTVFFNNTIISCGLSSFWESNNRSCLTWRPGDTHWKEEYLLTSRIQNTVTVVTSYGAWFMDFAGQVSNVLTSTEGNFEQGPVPTLSPRTFPCITVHPESDSVIVISGFMYKENSTVEMYTGNMTFWRYLPQLYPPRQSHSCASIGNFIVVAGGINISDIFRQNPLKTVQVLNLASKDKWVEYPPLANKMFDGIMANLLGSLVIVGGTEDILLPLNSSLVKNTENIDVTQPHNTSITNNFLLDYPFERSSVVGILTVRELGHTIVPFKINDICNREK